MLSLGRMQLIFTGLRSKTAHSYVFLAIMGTPKIFMIWGLPKKYIKRYFLPFFGQNLTAQTSKT